MISDNIPNKTFKNLRYKIPRKIGHNSINYQQFTHIEYI